MKQWDKKVKKSRFWKLSFCLVNESRVRVLFNQLTSNNYQLITINDYGP
jgi:hypothetical protein